MIRDCLDRRPGQDWRNRAPGGQGAVGDVVDREYEVSGL